MSKGKPKSSGELIDQIKRLLSGVEMYHDNDDIRQKSLQSIEHYSEMLYQRLVALNTEKQEPKVRTYPETCKDMEIRFQLKEISVDRIKFTISPATNEIRFKISDQLPPGYIDAFIADLYHKIRQLKTPTRTVRGDINLSKNVKTIRLCGELIHLRNDLL